VPALGATLPFSAHVDLTWRCHGVCLQAGLPATYAGMTVLVPPAGGSSGQAGGVMRIATCGSLHKYRGSAAHRWADYVLAALGGQDGQLLHIGPSDPGFETEITQALETAGLDPARYVFAGSTPNLAGELIARGAAAYLASYPVSGGKANLEAMSVGIAPVVPTDPQGPTLLQFDFPAPTWIPVFSPDETPAALARSLEITRSGQVRDAVAAELERFTRYVLDDPRAASSA